MSVSRDYCAACRAIRQQTDGYELRRQSTFHPVPGFLAPNNRPAHTMYSNICRTGGDTTLPYSHVGRSPLVQSAHTVPSAEREATQHCLTLVQAGHWFSCRVYPNICRLGGDSTLPYYHVGRSLILLVASTLTSADREEIHRCLTLVQFGHWILRSRLLRGYT